MNKKYVYGLGARHHVGPISYMGVNITYEKQIKEVYMALRADITYESVPRDYHIPKDLPMK